MPPTAWPAVHNEPVSQRQWRAGRLLSRAADRLDRDMAQAKQDKAPWLIVAFALGIASWFALPNSAMWVMSVGGPLTLSLALAVLWRDRERRQMLLLAIVSLSVAFSFGTGTIWVRSAMVGTEPIDRPSVQTLDGTVVTRQDQPADDRVRLTLAVRDPEQGRAIKVRVNVPWADATPQMDEGARLKMKARLMPPAAPLLPGGYNFARAAWFDRLSASGSVLGDIEVIEPPNSAAPLAQAQRNLARHVRTRVGGDAGTIAATFASGDRGAISQADEEAMRDAGLTHLLAISGLHVGAVIAASWFLTAKLLALFPPIALRIKVPLWSAAISAATGIAYTLLTGAQVPTVRSCFAALLVLTAMALGRQPLSFRMIATAALFVLLLWPETLIGPSFQMSFGAVLAIVALHSSDWAKRVTAPREQSWAASFLRKAFMLFVTGLVIELTLMPIVLFHFHRAGLYGAFANVIAIPLVTFASMPLIAAALLLDIVGLGGPLWWLVGRSLDLLLGIAHFTSSLPGAVKMMPQMGVGTLMLFVCSGLWLALWKGPYRMVGLAPMALGVALMISAPIPDLLVSRDGTHVGVVTTNGALVTLRDTRSSYALDNMRESAAFVGEPISMREWEGGRCSRDFCSVILDRGARQWSVLIARSNHFIEERALFAACERADIVIASRRLPNSCKPRWLKADRRYLDERGGLAINLERGDIESVADAEGDHGWWNPRPFEQY